MTTVLFFITYIILSFTITNLQLRYESKKTDLKWQKFINDTNWKYFQSEMKEMKNKMKNNTENSI